MNREDETMPIRDSSDRAPSQSRHPTQIGPYRIRQVLGEGGFGVVYEAEQTEPVKRRVALKVIKPGMDSAAVLARFEAERQALAVMDHPCIAKVLDAGMTDEGRPYFAMDLVRGEPITDFCDRQRIALKDRLILFQRVCDAVQHAHTKGVIHRDLKPSNILVTYQGDELAPKVIDFGVAKALNQKLSENTIFTQQGQLIGTPEYMSPEQAEMGATDIDTRSDVYSLGVVLYELLTGARPFEPETLRKAGLAEIQRIIRETDPPKPSTRLASIVSHADDPQGASKIAKARRTEIRTLTGTLKRDLDWIVMKCLEKDRSRRYDTASELEAEVGRYLKDEPVVAGPPSVRYQLFKLVKRNKIPLAVVGVLFVSLLLVVSILAYSVAREIRIDQERESLRTIMYVISDEETEVDNKTVIQAIELTWSLFDDTRESAYLVYPLIGYFHGTWFGGPERMWSDHNSAMLAEPYMRRLISFAPSMRSEANWEDSSGNEIHREELLYELWLLLWQTDRAEESLLLVQDEELVVQIIHDALDRRAELRAACPQAAIPQRSIGKLDD